MQPSLRKGGGETDFGDPHRTSRSSPWRRRGLGKGWTASGGALFSSLPDYGTMYTESVHRGKRGNIIIVMIRSLARRGVVNLRGRLVNRGKGTGARVGGAAGRCGPRICGEEQRRIKGARDEGAGRKAAFKAVVRSHSPSIMGGKAEAQPPTPTRAGSARQQGKKDAKGAADDKKEGKSIQDTAVYGEIVQNLVGLHEFGKEAAAARQDGDVQTGGIKESVVDGKKKVQKAAPGANARAVAQPPPTCRRSQQRAPSMKIPTRIRTWTPPRLPTGRGPNARTPGRASPGGAEAATPVGIAGPCLGVGMATCHGPSAVVVFPHQTLWPATCPPSLLRWGGEQGAAPRQPFRWWLGCEGLPVLCPSFSPRTVPWYGKCAI